MILFVCTGNTCRSAMAEAFATALGIEAASAGLAAEAGDPATPRTITVMEEVGLDLRSHTATPLARVTARPDRILVMTERHAALIRRDFPGLSGLVELLDPDGDIADPWIGDLDLYRTTRDRIKGLVADRLHPDA